MSDDGKSIDRSFHSWISCLEKVLKGSMAGFSKVGYGGVVCAPQRHTYIHARIYTCKHTHPHRERVFPVCLCMFVYVCVCLCMFVFVYVRACVRFFQPERPVLVIDIKHWWIRSMGYETVCGLRYCLSHAGCMDCMDVWTDGRMYGCMDGWMYACYKVQNTKIQ